jgi:transposase
MGKGSGITRGDRRRNAKKARLRALVPEENAVAGLDLGEKRQALAVTGADGVVLARRSPQVSVHDLGPYLDRALAQARAAGYAGLSVACEPTGSRWMVSAETPRTWRLDHHAEVVACLRHVRALQWSCHVGLAGSVS